MFVLKIAMTFSSVKRTFWLGRSRDEGRPSLLDAVESNREYGLLKFRANGGTLSRDRISGFLLQVRTSK